MLKAAQSDPFWGVRKEAVNGFSSLKSKRYSEDLIELSENQDNRVRRAVWNSLKNYENNEKVSTFLQNIIGMHLRYSTFTYISNHEIFFKIYY